MSVNICEILGIDAPDKRKRIDEIKNEIDQLFNEIGEINKETDKIVKDTNGELKAIICTEKDENGNDITVEKGPLVEMREASKKVIEKTKRINELEAEFNRLLSEEDNNGSC